MWSDGGANDQGGGFLNSSATFASPSDPEKKPARRAQNIVPVTIRQINSNGDDFKIGDFEIQLVSVVALVETIEVSSTKVTYTVSDDTGKIEAVLWLEGPVENNDVVEETYCRIFGSIRSHQGKRHIMIFKIHALRSLDELTCHLLEVMECNLAAEGMKLEEGQQSQQSHQTSNKNAGLSNSLMDVKMENKSFGGVCNTDRLTMKQQWVLDIIRTTPGAIGPSKQDMVNALAGKVVMREMGEIVEFLSSEGHIYSTIDDDHYAFTS